jgi:hypothetical protein
VRGEGCGLFWGGDERDMGEGCLAWRGVEPKVLCAGSQPLMLS